MSEEIIDATQSTVGYLVSPLTDNINITDEGYLVIVGCPIARTGFQEYSVKDLPQKAARQLGIDISNPNATIELYRPASEVFSPEFLASLNGKPITDNHPEDFVNKENYREVVMGHIQNPRRGPRLDNGEEALIADLHITAEPLISKVRNKQARDISLGYDYGIRRMGKKIIQCDMLGNHNAIVPKGRAGNLVSIEDAAPELVIQEIPNTHPRAAPPGTAEGPPPAATGDGHAAPKTNAPSTIKKEKQKVKINLLHLLGLGLKAKAGEADVDPEELAQAAAELGKFQSPNARARAADAAEEEEEPVVDKKKGKDGKAKDDLGDPEDEDVEPVDDARKKMHDALDLMMDKRGKDADIGELKSLLDEYLSEEEAEPEHQEDAGDTAPLDEVLGAGETEDVEEAPEEEVVESGEEELEPAEDDEADMECAHCGTAMDGEACPECGCRDGKARDKAPAKDRARAADGALAVLKVLKPFVARSNDKAMINTWNAMLGSATKGSRASTSSHGGFASAARARDKSLKRARANDTDAIADRDARLQAAYDSAFKGGK